MEPGAGLHGRDLAILPAARTYAGCGNEVYGPAVTAERPDEDADADRDRDAAGRPRQARPRDALGRPLPYGATGVEPVPEDPLPPLATVDEAWRLVREGRPFSAHEVLEARWKAGPEGERDLWQGLAQICVGLTHLARGNVTGGRRLLDRGCGRIETYRATGGPEYGLQIPAILKCAREKTASGLG